MAILLSFTGFLPEWLKVKHCACMCRLANGPFCDVIHYQRKFFVFFIEKTHINQNSRIIFIDYAEFTKYAKFMKKYIDLKRAKLSFQ